MTVSNYQPTPNSNKPSEELFYVKTSIKNGRVIKEIIYDEDPSKNWHKFKELFKCCCCDPVIYQYGGRETKELIAKLLSGNQSGNLSFRNDKTRLMAQRHFEQFDARLKQIAKVDAAPPPPQVQMLPNPPPAPPAAAPASAFITPAPRERSEKEKEANAKETPPKANPAAATPLTTASADIAPPQMLPLSLAIEIDTTAPGTNPMPM
jgi:hypothetical protein